MLEKLLRYGELEKLEAHKLSDKEYSNFLLLESELTLNEFVLLDGLHMCERWKQPMWTKDIWPQSITAKLRNTQAEWKLHSIQICVLAALGR